jgi:Na+/H+-dicarboxylate symporter
MATLTPAAVTGGGFVTLAATLSSLHSLPVRLLDERR